LVWLKPTLAAACLIAAALATGIVVHFIERSLVQSGATVKVSPPAISPDTGVHAAPAVRPSVPRHPKVHRPQPALAEPTSDRRMSMRLPYSNCTIATGTDTTIQVSTSHSVLL